MAASPLIRHDGEASPVSTRWLVGVLLTIVMGAGGAFLLRLDARLAEQERLSAKHEEARKVLESEVRGEIRSLRADQQRTLRLVVLLAKRAGIEVAE